MLIKDIRIKDWLKKTLETVGIHTLTDIQKAALPFALNGDDVIGILMS